MDKFREEVRDLLSGLTSRGKILFAIITGEKLYPNYLEFENTVGWGNHVVLSDATSLIYQYLIKEDLFSPQDIEDMITRVDLITPDTEDFPGILTSFALDACTAIYSTLQFMIDGDNENIIDVATYARDTVDMFIQERDDMNSLDPAIETKIEFDTFMVREKYRQRELIGVLSKINLNVINDGLISSLKTTDPIIDLSLLS